MDRRHLILHFYCSCYEICVRVSLKHRSDKTAQFSFVGVSEAILQFCNANIRIRNLHSLWLAVDVRGCENEKKAQQNGAIGKNGHFSVGIGGASQL